MESSFYNFFCSNFSDIFFPLFEVTQNPKSHPGLEELLQDVSGFDSVDDESKPDARVEYDLITFFLLTARHNTPASWNTPINPPYFYYMYYMYSNILQLNAFRSEKGLSKC